MVTATDNFITVGGLTIHYTEFGSVANPHMLCLHGWSLESHTWDVFAQHASARYHVVCPSFPGHGDSDRRASYDDQFADIHLLAALMDALGMGSATVLGHSMGGSYAGGLSIFHPQKVERIVMVDSGLDTRPPGAERFQKWIDAWQPEYASVAEARAFVEAHFVNFSPASVESMLRHAGRVLDDGRFQWKFDASVMRARKSPQPDPPDESPLWPFIAQIKCPTLIVRGANSDLLRREIVERMVATLPQGSSVEAPGLGHGMMLEDELVFYDAVKEFLSLP